MNCNKLGLRMVSLLLLLVVLVSPVNVSAQKVMDLRVGLTCYYSGKDRIHLDVENIGFGYSIANSYVCEEQFTSKDGFTFTSEQNDFFVLSSQYTSYSATNTVVKRLSKYGLTAYGVSVSRNKWLVYVKSTTKQWSTKQVKAVITKSAGYEISRQISDNGQRVKMSGSAMTLLYDGEVSQCYPQVKALDPNKNGDYVLNLGTRSYRGRIEIGRYGKNTLTAVNILAIDSYLYGVVPSEMSSSWPMEALKAQAVCARGYAVSKSGFGSDSNLENPYRITDTTSFQAYRGYLAETERTSEAVNKTRGQVVSYQGEIICSYYFSTSGGATENANDVWGSNIPYLQSVMDEYETEPEMKPWVIIRTRSELEKKMGTYGYHIGNIDDLSIARYNNSGSVASLLVKGSNSSAMLVNERVRTTFDLYSTKYKVVTKKENTDTVAVLSADGISKVKLGQSYAVTSSKAVQSLKGTDNRIYIVKSADGLSPFIHTGPATDQMVYFVGIGYGHGVGMSQSGARGMAKAGYTYDKIIQHYYRGCKITHL